MKVTDLPRLVFGTYGDTNTLRQEVRRFIDSGRKLTPTKKAIYAQWFADALTALNEQLGTSAGGGGGGLPAGSIAVKEGDSTVIYTSDETVVYTGGAHIVDDTNGMYLEDGSTIATAGQQVVFRATDGTPVMVAPLDLSDPSILSAQVPDGSFVLIDGGNINVSNANGNYTKFGFGFIQGGVAQVNLTDTDWAFSQNESIAISDGVTRDDTLYGTLVIDPDNGPSILMDSTQCGLADGQIVSDIVPTGTYVDKVTFSVSGGVITAIALG